MCCDDLRHGCSTCQFVNLLSATHTTYWFTGEVQPPAIMTTAWKMQTGCCHGQSEHCRLLDQWRKIEKLKPITHANLHSCRPSWIANFAIPCCILFVCLTMQLARYCAVMRIHAARCCVRWYGATAAQYLLLGRALSDIAPPWNETRLRSIGNKGHSTVLASEGRQMPQAAAGNSMNIASLRHNNRKN